MLRNRAIAAAGLLAALLFVFGATVLGARSSKPAQIAGVSIDVMRMMADAKDLPTQQFDAI
jgi:hypothetical protein